MMNMSLLAEQEIRLFYHRESLAMPVLRRDVVAIRLLCLHFNWSKLEGKMFIINQHPQPLKVLKTSYT